MDMPMTYYMKLLATNQPWNLILFMAIPVILAEFIAVTELFILLRREPQGSLKKYNRIASILAGIYFTGVFVYLFFNAVIPITASGAWRGIGDVIAVGFYLLGIVPLGGMALLELGLLGRKADDFGRLKIHASFVAIFLVVAHIALIFGMLSPEVLMAPHVM